MDEKKTVVPPPNNKPYIIAVVMMVLIALGGISFIVIFRPESDIVVVIASVTGFVTPTTLSLLAFMKSQETHLSVNSRLDSFIRNAEQAAKAEGVDEGRQLANDRTDSLAAQAQAQDVPLKE